MIDRQMDGWMMMDGRMDRLIDLLYALYSIFVAIFKLHLHVSCSVRMNEVHAHPNPVNLIIRHKPRVY